MNYKLAARHDQKSHIVIRLFATESSQAKNGILPSTLNHCDKSITSFPI